MDIDGLIDSFNYIEKTRAWAVNKGGKPRMSAERRADLYYAGHFVLKAVRDKGTERQNQRINDIISGFESCFI